MLERGVKLSQFKLVPYLQHALLASTLHQVRLRVSAGVRTCARLGQGARDERYVVVCASWSAHSCVRVLEAGDLEEGTRGGRA